MKEEDKKREIEDERVAREEDEKRIEVRVAREAEDKKREIEDERIAGEIAEQQQQQTAAAWRFGG